MVDVSAPALPRLDAPQRALDGLRKLAGALASPLVPEDYLDLFDPLRSGADLRGRVVSVVHETSDAVTTTIRPGKGWRGHVPGQYIRIGVDIDGVRHWRAYSLTSRTDRPDGLITITTKAIPDGKVSGFLTTGGLTPGTLVHLDQATGDFTLPVPAPAKLLFVTAGSGITPVMGMLRNRLSGPDPLRDVVHVHISPTAAASLFRTEREAYAAPPAPQPSAGAQPGPAAYRLIERHDDTDGLTDLARDIDDLVPDWREREAWVCGPTGLLDSAELLWAEHELTHALHVERFRPTVIEGGEGGEITFLRSDLSVDADGTTPILDAGEEAGVLMPSGCRMGICFGCVVTLREGAVRDLRTGELTIAEPGDELTIQTCINAVAGTCDIDL
jgi:ferredoxin-NADP reductase